MDTLPTITEIMRRYETACDLKQAVNPVSIESKLNQWIQGISKQKVTVRQAKSQDDYKSSLRAARAARVAWAARAAWDARAARAAWVAWAARAARAARAAWAAWNARAAWDATYHSHIVIGAIITNDIALFNMWYPLFEAFEAGLWQLCIAENEIVYLSLPIIHLDSERRLHADNGYAFTWLDSGDYYYHGVYVSEQIIMHPDTITVAEIHNEQNAEVRRVMMERYRLSEQVSGEVSGEALYIQDANVALRKTNTFGSLYVAQFDDDEPLCYVKVTCPSTQRVYWLRVDPNAYKRVASREPQAAVASTWRKSNGSLFFEDWRDYAPVEQS